MVEYNDIIFEISRPGRIGSSLPESDVNKIDLKDKLPMHLIRDIPAELPEVSELQLVRHYTALSIKTMGLIMVLSTWFLYDEIQPEDQ